ncbi:hypothetical protein [Streptomyces sp. NPDC089919]
MPRRAARPPSTPARPVIFPADQRMVAHGPTARIPRPQLGQD